MRCTFREAIDFYASNDLEFDAVIGGEDTGYTFSFNGKPTFTDYCEEKYGKLLDAECEIKPDDMYTDSVIVEFDDSYFGRNFAKAWAGYVSETEYNKLFEE